VRADIDAHGVSPRGHFVQHTATDAVDASLLLLPTVGFCAADDPRMLATVAEIERTLMVDGLVLRYRTESGVDGLAGTENPFLACSFWLVEQYAASGRLADAGAHGPRCAARTCRPAVGGYDVAEQRQAGNTRRRSRTWLSCARHPPSPAPRPQPAETAMPRSRGA
jgi:hypothetical protein